MLGSTFKMSERQSALSSQQALFRGPILTDAGCTLRLMKRDVLDTLLPLLTVGDGHFQADLTNLAMIKKVRLIEVPVRFTSTMSRRFC